ncbi:hypothetical protein FHS55_002644 [Angulomicrobium tetraedrale]|uniref:Putative phage metallopeptidase domain-containing protein n=1 Tax=Ancylobacter tetraedralis TaxID=217068 RepID=A0A839ZBD1_9HYPH|nr:putative metallopeptidase [Ancylobacter tetraedralis]MBB3772035.1 hypothetical protein [Ancylobacter tetraedralis]
MLDGVGDDFRPSRDLAEWALACFVEPASAIANPDHAHLEHASLGFLWTNVANARAGRRIVGQCELGEPAGMTGRWAKARARAQIAAWFGDVPDFIVTIDAAAAVEMTDAEFCALIEHELYHAGQERDPFGAPKFRQTGAPAFAIRGHDVEEFVGVVRRYGAGAAGVAALVEAARMPPQIASTSIAGICGTCHARAA